jgi:hypothetical protein
MKHRIQWPDGKQFAFTVFDDTDLTTMRNGPVLYDFLTDLGFRTTKSVWPLLGSKRPPGGGDTCEDEPYLRWVLQLQQKGFEIGFHGAAPYTSVREDTRRGIERFRELFGHYPYTHTNHGSSNEAIHWCENRLTGVHALIYTLMTRGRRRGMFQGHMPESPLFWGDICRERITYVRNFVFGDINTLKACPFMPYHDPLRPFVQYWFASSEGASCKPFVDRISEGNQDRLAEEGGACIMYTHFGLDFVKDGVLDPCFKERMTRLSRLNGWFVPVKTLLDYLLERNGRHCITDRERARLERRWLWHKVFVGAN